MEVSGIGMRDRIKAMRTLVASQPEGAGVTRDLSFVTAQKACSATRA